MKQLPNATSPQQPPAPQPGVTVEILLLQVIQLLQAQQKQVPTLAVNEAQQPATSGPETMDVAETAKYLRVSAWTVRDMVRTKSIPFFRIRSRIFFRKRELDQWIIQQGVRNSSAGK